MRSMIDMLKFRWLIWVLILILLEGIKKDRTKILKEYIHAITPERPEYNLHMVLLLLYLMNTTWMPAFSFFLLLHVSLSVSWCLWNIFLGSLVFLSCCVVMVSLTVMSNIGEIIPLGFIVPESASKILPYQKLNVNVNSSIDKEEICLHTEWILFSMWIAGLISYQWVSTWKVCVKNYVQE